MKNPMQKKNRLIVTDIDGTIYETQQHRIPESTMYALQELKYSGCYLAICTSRSREEMIHIPSSLLNMIDVIVCDCGGDLSFEGQRYYTPMILQETQQIIRELDRLRIVYRYVTDKGHGYLNRNVPDIDALFDYEYEMVPPQKAYEQEPLVHIVYYTNHVSQVQQIRALAAHEKLLDFSYVHEITAANIDKGSSLRRIAQLLHIRREETAAFGDGASDVELLRMAGIGIAMGNGSPICKKNADYVTDCIQQGGFLNACKAFRWVR